MSYKNAMDMGMDKAAFGYTDTRIAIAYHLSTAPGKNANNIINSAGGLDGGMTNRTNFGARLIIDRKGNVI